MYRWIAAAIVHNYGILTLLTMFDYCRFENVFTDKCARNLLEMRVKKKKRGEQVLIFIHQLYSWHFPFLVKFFIPGATEIKIEKKKPKESCLLGSFSFQFKFHQFIVEWKQINFLLHRFFDRPFRWNFSRPSSIFTKLMFSLFNSIVFSVRFGFVFE